jgi:hypothetical protein
MVLRSGVIILRSFHGTNASELRIRCTLPRVAELNNLGRRQVRIDGGHPDDLCEDAKLFSYPERKLDNVSAKFQHN